MSLQPKIAYLALAFLILLPACDNNDHRHGLSGDGDCQICNELHRKQKELAEAERRKKEEEQLEKVEEYECSASASTFYISIEASSHHLLVSKDEEFRFSTVLSYANPNSQPTSVFGKWNFKEMLWVEGDQETRMSPSDWEKHPKNQGGFISLSKIRLKSMHFNESSKQVRYVYMAKARTDDESDPYQPCDVTVQAEFTKLNDDHYVVETGKNSVKVKLPAKS